MDALYYNFYRYYSPELGRYLNKDPIGLGGGINEFGYVGGSPLKYLDYSGLDGSLIPGTGDYPDDYEYPTAPELICGQDTCCVTYKFVSGEYSLVQTIQMTADQANCQLLLTELVSKGGEKIGAAGGAAAGLYACGGNPACISKVGSVGSGIGEASGWLLDWYMNNELEPFIPNTIYVKELKYCIHSDGSTTVTKKKYSILTNGDGSTTNSDGGENWPGIWPISEWFGDLVDIIIW